MKPLFCRFLILKRAKYSKLNAVTCAPAYFTGRKSSTVIACGYLHISEACLLIGRTCLTGTITDYQ